MGLLAMGHRVSDAILPAPTLRAWGQDLGVGLVVGCALVWLSRVAVRRWDRCRFVAREFRDVVGSLGPWSVFWIALLSGTSEEILFRGALQPALGPYLAVATFAMLHVGPTPRFIPWTMMAICGGGVFAGLFAWSGCVLPSALAHVTVNFLNLRFLTAQKVSDASAQRLVNPRAA